MAKKNNKKEAKGKEPKKREPTNTGVDLDVLHTLALKQNTVLDISKLLNVDESTVRRLLKEFFPHLEDLKLFKDNRVDIYRSLQSLAAKSLIFKIPLSNVKDLTSLIAMFEEKINLAEGKSTQNIAVGIKIEHLVAEREKVFKYLRDKGVSEEELEVEFNKLIQLPTNLKLPLSELGINLPEMQTPQK